MVSILLIGDEILSASVREVNLEVMLKVLTGMGYQVGEVRIVGDDVATIADALAQLRERSEYVLTAGGIGPTHDDVTLEAAASAFDVPVERNEKMLAFLRTRYGDPLSPMVAHMADMPAATEVYGCEHGNWPVIRWENVFVLPGLPRALVDKMDRIREMLPHFGPTWTGELYLSADESIFADWLATVQQSNREVTIGSYPVVGDYDYRSRLVVKGLDRDSVAAVTGILREYVADRAWLVRLGGDI